jgi:hypothetical protein
LSNSRIEMTGVRGLEDRTIDMIQFEWFRKWTMSQEFRGQYLKV